MTIKESVEQQLGEEMVNRAKELGWDWDASTTESALDYLLRMQYEKGVQDGVISQITEVGKYKRTVMLQRRMQSLQSQRLTLLEQQLRSGKAGQDVTKVVQQATMDVLNENRKVNFGDGCRAQQVDQKGVCKCGNIWNLFGEFWPRCRK